MKIYLICPVRNVTEEQQKEIDNYAKALEDEGHQVHNPRYAADQTCETGLGICEAHKEGMSEAQRVDIFWDISSYGSHFDLGMAFAMGIPVKLVKLYKEDTEGKSYVKVIKALEKNK